MIMIEGKKFACQACIRGHRASSCNHTARELTEIRPKGRPITQCEKCRYLRKTRKAHVKCLCSEVDREPQRKSRRLNAESIPRSRVSSIENLLNPCKCSEARFCTCCRPMFSEYLNKNYPSAVIEETARSFSAHLMMPAQAPTPVPSSIPECPSGPDAPCCKIETQPEFTGHSPFRTPPPPHAALALSQPHSASPSAAAVSRTGSHTTIPALDLPARTLGVVPQGIMQSTVAKDDNLGMPMDSQAITRSADGKPNCKCGCDCGKKLELLIQAIEARIGQPVHHSAVLDKSTQDSDEWIENILSPLSPTIRPSDSSASLSAKDTTTADTSDPESMHESDSSASATDRSSGIHVPYRQGSTNAPAKFSFADDVVPPIAQPASSGGCCGSESPPKEPASQQDMHMIQPLPPPSSAAAGSHAGKSSCCGGSELVSPQQAMPLKASCCDTAGTGSCADSKANARPSCCSSSSSSSSAAGVESGGCSCCKQRKRQWQPGNPCIPEVDADGALACSCGCHKPFEECKDCLEDLCEEVLFKPS